MDIVFTDEQDALYQLVPDIAGSILRLLVKQVESVSTDKRDALCQVLLPFRGHMTELSGKSKKQTYASW
jgi:hypothetical protein